VTLAEEPDLATAVRRLQERVWPAYMQQTEAERHYYEYLFTIFADLQVIVRDHFGEVIAYGHLLPLAWNGVSHDMPSGWEAALAQGVRDYERGRAPTVASALEAVVAPEHRGEGLGSTIVSAMRAAADWRGLRSLLVPVRPTLKSRYPLTPIEHYVTWRRADGSPFDPWLRVHWRLGARQLAIASRSMVITGTLREWEDWTSMRFPESGRYIVPDALAPVVINHARNLGTYIEPNVWMIHDV
jgi:GNAT superfamily N-acetyltransferase